MIAEIETLIAAVDGLAALDPASLDETELHQAAMLLQRQRARLGGVAAGVLGRWDNQQVWAGDGSLSGAARLSRETNCALSTARAELRRARASAQMPATTAAVVAGRLSLDHLELMARANQTSRANEFAADETGLVEQCVVLRFAQACRLIAYWCQTVDATGCGEQADRRRDNVHLHASTTLDGVVVIDGCWTRSAGRSSKKSSTAWNTNCTSPT